MMSVQPLRAQTSVATTPVGYVQQTLAPSPNAVSRGWSTVSFPLHQIPVFVGLVAFTSSNTITLSGTIPAGLTGTSPYLVHVEASANSIATGQSFLITAAGTNSVTVSSTSFSVQSILTTGDQVAIRGAETLASIFGSLTSGTSTVQLQTGTTAAGADLVYIWSGTGYNSYYFYTGYWWVNSIDGGYANQNNVVIYPDEMILVGRISTATLPVSYAASMGAVPTNAQTATLNSPGESFVSNPLPVPVSLSQFGFTNSPSWQTATTAAGADLVYMWQNNGWQAYYYYTGYWWVLATDGGYANQNSTTVPAGSGVLVIRHGSVAAPNNYVSTPLTYSLN
jgi:hypothetical protein